MNDIAKRNDLPTDPSQDQPNRLIELAINQKVPVETLERLMAMNERVMARGAENEFNQSMADCQAEMRRVATDATNPQTHSKYASYAALDKVLRPIYTKHGFAPSFDTGETEKAETVRVLCHLSHRGGHSRTYHIDMPADGKGAKGGDVMTKTHATGSAITYGQRYLLKAMFNVAIGADDDGNGADATGMPEGQKADYASAIESLIDRPAGEKLWKLIAKACKETKDKAAYDSLKEKMFAKLKSFEGKGVKK